MDGILEKRGVRRSQFNLREVRKCFFKSFQRRAVCRPQGLAASMPEPDELYAGKRKATLEFFLPKSSYATMLFKAMTGKP
jgi:tRNA pseudouridine13 synthase